MQRNMKQKRSKTKMQTRDSGFNEKVMKDIHETFKRHGQLLLLLNKLDVIPARYVSILCKDFEQKTWSKIRDGDDYGSETDY